MPTLSFVAPVYNEQEGLEHFHERLTAAADELGESYEIVFVNDGSEDDTEAVLSRLMERDARVRVVEFSRNFGHQVAVTAGYDHAAGRAVVSLDADCQHPPEMIGEMVRLWREGFEVIYTVRQNTDGISPIRRAIGRGAYRLIKWASGVDLTDQADFRLLDRRAVDALCGVREQARFVRGLVSWIGFRQARLTYVAEERAAGASSYTLKQLVNMTTAGVFNFSLKPLRMVGGLGGALLGGALLWALVWLVLWPLGVVAGAWWHVAGVIVGLSGLQLLALSLVGEYVGRTFEQVKARPLYVVRRRLGFSGPTPTRRESGAAGPSRTTVYT